MIAARRVARLGRDFWFPVRISLISTCSDLEFTVRSSVVRSDLEQYQHPKIWINSIRFVCSLKAKNTATRCAHGTAGQEGEVATSPRWTTVPRPVLETLLKSYAHHPTVAQPLFLHGPRGVGKRTAVERLVRKWNRCPHIAVYIDLYSKQESVPPWTMTGSFGGHQNCLEAALLDSKQEEQSSVSMGMIRSQVEQALELLAKEAVEMGCIESENVLDALLERHTIDGALSQFLRADEKESNKFELKSSNSTNEKWRKSIQLMAKTEKVSFAALPNTVQLSNISSSAQQGQLGSKISKPLSISRTKSAQETFMSLSLAKQLLKIQEEWRVSSGAKLNSKGVVTKASADAATSWATLLIRLLSFSVKQEHFQPKLVINNIDLMRKAPAESPGGSVHGSLYHDSLLMHIRKIGVNFGCIPIIFMSSDSYYSCKVFADHGDELAFISQEALGWTPKEAAVHFVPAIFEEPEWNEITGVLGPTARHLAELHSIWNNPSFLEVLQETSENAMGDCVDLYLGYLQVTAVDPAMEVAIQILVKFAEDSVTGKISKRVLKHGVAWRYPPSGPEKQRQWAKIQLVDYIQALAKTEFAVNHRDVRAKELLEDPSTNALLEVGLLYQQKELPYIRPITRGVSRCLVRWCVRERLNWSSREQLKYTWHRLIRGRFYKQLMII